MACDVWILASAEAGVQVNPPPDYRTLCWDWLHSWFAPCPLTSSTSAGVFLPASLAHVKII